MRSTGVALKHSILHELSTLPLWHKLEAIPGGPRDSSAAVNEAPPVTLPLADLELDALSCKHMGALWAYKPMMLGPSICGVKQSRGIWSLG